MGLSTVGGRRGRVGVLGGEAKVTAVVGLVVPGVVTIAARGVSVCSEESTENLDAGVLGGAMLSRVSSGPLSRLVGLGVFSTSVRSGEEGSSTLRDEGTPFANFGCFRFLQAKILRTLRRSIGSVNKKRHNAMERMPPRTEAMTMIRVEGVTIRVVLLSLMGLGVGLAAKMAGYTDEDKTTSPGPLIGGKVGEMVGCDARKVTREVGVDDLSPPWPGDPGVVASVIATKTSWIGFNLGLPSEGEAS